MMILNWKKSGKLSIHILIQLIITLMKKIFLMLKKEQKLLSNI